MEEVDSLKMPMLATDYNGITHPIIVVYYYVTIMLPKCVWKHAYDIVTLNIVIIHTDQKRNDSCKIFTNLLQRNE